jgi:hypothetical protein
MRTSSAFFIVGIFCSLCAVATAQSATGATPVQAAPSVTAPPAPSGLLQPALDQVQQTVSALRLEKWKRGDVRDEAGDHIGAILRDLQTNLPPLLQTADASPATITKMLPVSRNVAALYDVLLSVVQAARVSGSAEDVNRLEQALMSLGKARVALDDGLQASAAALEKREIDLRSTLQAREAVKCPVAAPAAAPVCPAPAPVRKKKPKPPATPAKPSPASPANSTPKTQN